jgi:O-antigen/teichoic acid export membrane protein
MSPIKKLFDKLIRPEQYSLKIKSLRAAAWGVLEKGAANGLRMVSSLILTRILYPEAFGLMATVFTILAMIQLYADTGVKMAIIQKAGSDSEVFLNTAWVISILRGCILFGIILVLSWPLSLYYDQPSLKGLLFVMAIGPLLSGLENPALALVIKTFRVEKQAALELGSQASGVIASIVLSSIYKSVYALAFGALVSTVYKVVGSYIVYPYHPRFKWDPAAGRELFHFGKFIFINTIISWTLYNLDVFLVGKLLGMEPLGVYNIGRNIAFMVPIFSVQILSQSFLPAVSSVLGDTDRIIRIYKKTSAFIIMGTVPLSMTVALFSADITRLLYDSRYQAASIAMCWIGLSGVFRIIGLTNSSLFFGIGKPSYETTASAVGLMLALILVPLGIKSHAIFGSAFAVFIVITAVSIIQSIFLKPAARFPIKIIIRPWIQATLSAGVFAGVFFLFFNRLNNAPLYNLPLFLTTMAIGLIASVGTYILFEGTRPFQDYKAGQ